MKIGCHVSIAGGVFHAPQNAHEVGCECYQMFTRSPQGGPAPVLSEEVVQQFKSENKKYGYTDYVIHTPYYINFASTTPRIRYSSVAIVRDELERGTLLGAGYVMTHLGSTKDAGPKLGFHKTWRSIQRILDGYKGSCQLLLENSAGAGDLVGSKLEELAALIHEVESDAKYKNMVGVCLDTCHLFAAGYDLTTATAVNKALKLFDQTVGLKRLQVIHGNDSKFAIDAKKDRHEHIGKGCIGLEGFRALVNHSKLKNVNIYVETQPDHVADDIATLKKMRG